MFDIKKGTKFEQGSKNMYTISKSLMHHWHEKTNHVKETPNIRIQSTKPYKKNLSIAT